MPLGGRAFADLEHFLEAVDVVTVASPATTTPSRRWRRSRRASRSMWKSRSRSASPTPSGARAAAAKGLVVACGIRSG
jgi:hypothetical protein